MQCSPGSHAQIIGTGENLCISAWTALYHISVRFTSFSKRHSTWHSAWWFTLKKNPFLDSIGEHQGIRNEGSSGILLCLLCNSSSGKNYTVIRKLWSWDLNFRSTVLNTLILLVNLMMAYRPKNIVQVNTGINNCVCIYCHSYCP
jgi:hypothetical protein